MNICEATNLRIHELRRERQLSVYALIYQCGMPASTVKSILRGKSRNPGIVNIKKIAEGLGISIREFFDSDLFNDLDAD